MDKSNDTDVRVDRDGSGIDGVPQASVIESAVSISQARAETARKKRKTKAIFGTASVAIVFVVILGLAAFQGAFDFSSATDEAVAADAQNVSENGDTKTVTDSTGRTVEVPIEPISIATMDPFSGELLVMCGADSKICGIPAGVVSDKILQQIYPNLSSEPAQMSGNAVNVETLIDRGCDVALVKSTLSEAERAKLEKVGIPYIVVEYTTMNEQIAAMKLVGEVCGGDIQKKAEALAKYYEGTIVEVEAKAAQIPEDERISVYHSINEILLTDASGSLGADWVERVGCINVAATQAATSGSDYSTSVEQVYNWNPDMIICNAASTTSTALSESKWSALSAVMEKEVYTIPTGATRWGQRGDVETYLALLWLGCTVYPEYYDDIDLKQRVVEYYRDYLGVEVDDEMYTKIISGEGIRSEGTGGGDGSGSGGGGS